MNPETQICASFHFLKRGVAGHAYSMFWGNWCINFSSGWLKLILRISTSMCWSHGLETNGEINNFQQRQTKNCEAKKYFEVSRSLREFGRTEFPPTVLILKLENSNQNLLTKSSRQTLKRPWTQNRAFTLVYLKTSFRGYHIFNYF